jgi:hypothetical protein
MSVDNNEISEKLLAKFEADVIEVIHHESATGRLTETGTARLALRESINGITKAGEIQLHEVYQLRLTLAMAYGLKAQSEFGLASELFNRIIDRFDARTNSEFEQEWIVGRVEATVGEVECDYALSSTSPQTRSAPMAVSVLLRCIHRLRSGLETLAQLKSKQQEELAWLYLNCCKMIIEIGQPLVWTSCGKYIVVSVMFAISCVEDVINLCTWRHLQLRLKLYSTAFYGALTQLGIKEAQNVLNQLKQQLIELRERESLDLPMPDRVECALAEAEIDLAVMTRVLSFWKDPDSLKVAEPAAPAASAEAPSSTKPDKGKSVKPGASVAPAENPAGNKVDYPDASMYTCSAAKDIAAKRWFGDRVLCECARVQQMTSGNPNEMWKKRLNAILRAFWASFEGANIDDYDGHFLAEDKTRVTANNVKISLECLALNTMLIMFGVVDGLPISAILAKVWAVLDKFLPQHEPVTTVDTVDRAFHKYLEADSSLKPDINAVGVDQDCLHTLNVLRQLADIIDALSESVTEPAASINELLVSMSTRVRSLLYSDDCYRRRSLVHRVAISIWSKFVYQRLQVTLNSSEANGASVRDTLYTVSDPLVACVQMLDMSALEDPILVASLSVLSATLLNEVGDLRGAIALLKRGLELVDLHRSMRVDVSLHMPSDARDISALQRSSIQSSRDELDWFHSVKRLGAHAFAGFGIFGAGSCTDPSDLALADLHADMTALYFRYELAYSVEEYYQQKDWKRQLQEQAHPKASSPTRSHNKVASTMAPGSALNGAGTVRGLASRPVNAEKLPCIQFLRAFVCKNNYTKSILYMEMALIDTEKDRREEYLLEARRCIIEAETSEAALELCLRDLSLVPDGNNEGRSSRHGSEAKNAPIILARSHRCIYVAPTVSRRSLSSSVKFLRILAKEQGSGTDISLNSDFLGGTEAKVSIETLTHPTAGVVCIQPLRPGERYVVGCAAFDGQGAVIPNSLSATSVAVEALNPLNTVVLWGFLFTVCNQLKHAESATVAANIICGRYFESPSQLPPAEPVTQASQPLNRAVAKGLNLSVDNDGEPILCMLAVKQSTPVSLQYLVRAFLLAQEQEYGLDPTTGTMSSTGSEGSVVHWNLRVQRQRQLIVSVRKCAMIAIIATQLANHELIVRSVCLGFSLCSELCSHQDEMHAAQYVLSSLSVYIVSLQSVPKRHWHRLEHSLYVRLFLFACKASVTVRNTAPMALLLQSVYTECKELPELTVSAGQCESDYVSLLRMVGLCNRILLPPPPAQSQTQAAPNSKDKDKTGTIAADSNNVANYMNSSIEQDLLELLTQSSQHRGAFLTSDYLWKRVGPARQPAFGLGLAAALSVYESSAAQAQSQTPVSNLYRWIRESPCNKMSELLRIVVQLCSELLSQGNNAQTQTKIIQLLNRMTIYDKYFAPIVQTVIGPLLGGNGGNKLKFILVLPTPEAQAAKANAEALEAHNQAMEAFNKKGKPAKGATLPQEEPVLQTFTAEQFLVSECFVQADCGEIQDQLLFLAQICYLIATTAPRQSQMQAPTRNYYPKNKNGPMQGYDPSMPEHLQLGDEVAGKYKEYLEQVEARAEIQAQTPRAEVNQTQVVPTPANAKKGGSKIAGGPEETTANHATSPVPLDVCKTKNDYVTYLSIAVTLFAKSFSPASAVDACVSLWNNVMVDDWCDPYTFALETFPIKNYVQDAFFAVVKQMELMLGIGMTGQLAVSSYADADENSVLAQLAQNAAISNPVTARTLKEYALQLRDLCIFLTKYLWFFQSYSDVVNIGSRLITVYISVAPEFGKTMGYALFPLMKHAQAQIIMKGERSLQERTELLSNCVAEFEELMKKKRRKKLRIARVEKDEDELAFMRERDRIQGLVDEADLDLKFNIQRLADVEVQERLFLAQYGTGTQLVDKVRSLFRELYVDMVKDLLPADRGDVRILFQRPRSALEYSARIISIHEQCLKVGDFLRTKKDQLTLIELLKEQGDNYLLLGKFKEAKLCWFDLVDGYFNQLDVVQERWRLIVTEDSDDSLRAMFTDNVEDSLAGGAENGGYNKNTLMSGILPVIVALGKISRFTGSQDKNWDLKSNCVQLASKLSLVLFKESIGHPQSLISLAAYECHRSFGGLFSFSFNSEKMSSSELCVSLDEIVSTLQAEEFYLEQFPILVLLEYFHGVYTRSPEAWISVRCKRIRALIGAHLFAEAASMMASTIPSLNAIFAQSFDNPLAGGFSHNKGPTQGGQPQPVREAFDTSINGLDYYGRAPYLNHLPPHADANKDALTWIGNFVEEFQLFSKGFRIQVPESEQDPELVAARKAAAAASIAAKEAEVAASKDNKKSKKVDTSTAGAEGAKSVGDEDTDTVPRFDHKVQAEIAFICGTFYLALSQLDNRTKTPHAATLSSLSTTGNKLIQRCLLELGEGMNNLNGSDKLIRGLLGSSDGKWLSLYVQAKLQQFGSLICARQYKNARSQINVFLQFIQGFFASRNSRVYYPPDAVIAPDQGAQVQPPVQISAETQYQLSLGWNISRRLLAVIAERQSRFDDCVTITTQSINRDLSSLQSSFGKIVAYVIQIRTLFKSGNLAQAGKDCEVALTLCADRSMQSSSYYIQLCTLKASIAYEQCLSVTSSKSSVQTLRQCLSVLREALRWSQEVCRTYGFLGADSNVSFARATTCELEFDRLSPLVYNLSGLHCNEPCLSLKPAVRDTKSFREMIPTYMKNKPSTETADDIDFDADLDNEVDPNISVWNGRLANITNNEQFYVQSEFGNIYFSCVRQLSVVHSSLASLLIEIIASNATVEDEVAHQLPSHGKTLPKVGRRLTSATITPEQSGEMFFKSQLLRELISVAEDGLKVREHQLLSVFCDPCVHVVCRS